jgi:hypothetical protein
MEQERYNVDKDEEDFVYWFYSDGLRGKIRKGVKFQQKPELGKNVFNLAFGDWDESSGRLNDQVIRGRDISIASFWKVINLDFEVWGEVGENWGSFRKGVNYKRFLVFKKIK